MDKSISTALMIVVTMVMTLMLFNVAYPAITQSSDAVANMSYRASESLKTAVSIVHSGAELDRNGWWQDSNANGVFDVYVWVKNIGETRITALERMDVFIGPEGNFVRVPYVDEASGNYPRWSWQLENASEWTPSGTVRINIQYSASLPSGRYFLKLVLPDGLEASEIVGY
jgi:archaellum component FlaG (FlaF/FlaG flagellin family)